MKKKHLLSGLALAATAALALSGCSGGGSGGGGDAGSGDAGGDAPFKIANVVNGNLGDQGFFDDAERGIEELKGEGNETKTLQADVNNPAQWKANLESVSTGDWDIVVTGTTQMTDILAEAAPKFPDQQYVYYDAVVEAPNVASIVYKQNEGSYLAGVLAALAVTNPDTFPLAEGSTKVGVVGGMDIPVINDFVVGFEKGVESVDPKIEVLVSYVGDFADSAKGYDLGKGMFDDGAGVVFQVAGGAGVGALQAAKDANKYGIGVDSNQNTLQEGHILASMLKNIGNSIVLAVNDAKDGKLKFGETTAYGLANDGVGLTFDDNGGLVPDDMIAQIEEYKQKVISGEIEVPTASE
ncbi:BMP family lipoprotein [Leucobacter salsicius]|uniref:BMP family lipoprotein n=1 Tax=Leucobacter salsicius TaxID=664638 RepID=UPI0003459EA0|nr:BMP family ABC transporter substrate-binding protein [Leucobacter salsicius]